MNLVYDLRYASDHFPGIGTHAHALGAALLEEPAVTRVTYLWNRTARTSRFDLGALRRHPHAAWREDAGAPLSLATPFATGRLLRRSRPDAYLSPFWLRPVGASVPCVLTLHDVLPLVTSEGTSAPRRWGYRCALRWASGASAVITSSRFSAGEIARHTRIPAARVHVVPIGLPSVAAEPRRPAAAPDAPFALVVGSARAHKGHATLARAWRELDGAPPLALVRAGLGRRGDDPLAEAARESRDVHDLGPVAPAELEWLYRHATLLLVPSRYEGFGLPLLEAAARGAPVLASDIPALREIGDGVARFAPVDDPAAWAASVRELVANAPERERMREAGLERAARYTTSECARRVCEVVASVVGRPA